MKIDWKNYTVTLTEYEKGYDEGYALGYKKGYKDKISDLKKELWLNDYSKFTNEEEKRRWVLANIDNPIYH